MVLIPRIVTTDFRKRYLPWFHAVCMNVLMMKNESDLETFASLSFIIKCPGFLRATTLAEYLNFVTMPGYLDL